MSVRNVTVVVNIRTLKGRFIAHKFSNGWAVGMVKSVEKKKSVAGLAVKYKSDSLKRIAELKNETGKFTGWTSMIVGMTRIQSVG